MEQKTKEKCPLCGQELNDKAKAKKTKIENLKELYKRYCTCRDQEIDKFWKNSTFVWCFLLLCFGAFGKILLDYLDLSESDKKTDKGDTFLILLAIISYCGFFMSRIWTWMARGLKAWYEVYENVIWDIESANNIFKFDRKYTIDNYWNLKKEGFSFSNSDRISPSRIVIIIGHLLSIVWMLAFGKCLYAYGKCTSVYGWPPNKYFWTCFLCGLIVVFLCYKCLYSTTLRRKEEESIYKLVKCDLEHYNVSQTYFEIKKGEVSFWGANTYKTLKHIYNMQPKFKDNTFKFALNEMIEYYSYTNHLRDLLSTNLDLCSQKIIRKDDNIFVYTKKDLTTKVISVLNIATEIKYRRNKIIIPINCITLPTIGRLKKCWQRVLMWLNHIANALI